MLESTIFAKLICAKILQIDEFINIKLAYCV